ncbi:MAG: hypothetical protein K2M17_01315, partial [Bacilli bacterium]|nr:hypothetical protein [Bacilli bacterium]
MYIAQRNIILAEIKRKKDAALLDKTTIPLFGDAFNAYMEAKELRTAGMLDPNDALVINSALKNVASTVELLAIALDDEEKVYLENELSMAIESLQTICKKYTSPKGIERMRKKGN